MNFTHLCAIVLASISLCACTSKPVADKVTPVKVILETDMGNDVDDAMALDMLFKYAAEGKVEMLGISSNKRDEGSVEFIDALTTWYGAPELPIGRVENGVPCDDAVNYALLTVNMTDSIGMPLFARSHANDQHVVPSVEMYRELLAEQEDSAVTIISIGFSTNLAQLLDSPADAFSPLDGRELVARKVKNLVMMGGDFENNNPADSLERFCEYNIVKDIDAARKVFEQWPTDIVTSPFEVGIDICYPASSIENDFDSTVPNPVVEAYKVYLPMPYDRPTWDLTSVLYAIEGPGDYFTLSEPGTITVEPHGGTIFTPVPTGRHRYLMTDSIQKANILQRFHELLTLNPNNESNN